ncbi:MAG: TonB-dependent receptor domain-containing protein [Gammaproteobacteria bacterium]
MANRKIAHAVRVALMTAGAASAGLYGGALAAQEPLEEIVVTGTRIRDANLIATSPVATVSQDEFKFSGTTRVEDLLNTFPQLAPAFDSFTVNPTTGFATADLRGLGSQRTLVLVNGQRLPPGGIRGQSRDLNQIPAALVKRVEVLTGGASAVYGSDAMAGVVNFILDTDFEGVSVGFGASGYQHDNDNSRLRPLMEARNFSFPDGNRGPDGRAYNVDVAMGSAFADGKGHAMAYATWRKNRELRQGARDYSSCALNAAGTACGGSGTSVEPNFLIDRSLLDAEGNPLPRLNPDGTIFLDGNGNPVQQTLFGGARVLPDGGWAVGSPPPYNYAPINHYQRPDERYTFGSSVKYEVNEHFRPYLETMFANTNTSVQIAESGTFFVNELELDCTDSLLGSACADLNTQIRYGASVDENGDPIPVSERPLVDVSVDPTQPLFLYVGKRNVEGGPRISEIESNTFRIVTGVEGAINQSWDYNVAYLYSRNSSAEANVNDFVTSRIGDALLGCPEGSFNGCIPYNVWEYQSVTAEAAAALQGVGIRKGATSYTSFNGYVTGTTPFTFPTASDPVSLVAGFNYGKDEFQITSSELMATGDFAGLGGPRPPIDGSFDVTEGYFELGVPLYSGGDILQNLSADLGYRYSDYSTSGGVDSYKIGFSAQVTDYVRFRGGFNRAIRAPNVGELFAQQQLSLWSGSDPCAGDTPEFTAAQCANTGVSANDYGSISTSPASQYNQFSGGNPDLDPEEADTITFGFVATPIDGLQVSVDYFQIEISDRIGSIGANTILRFCGLTGDPFLCEKVNRSANGDLWIGSSLETSGFVENLNANFGNLNWSGLDLVVQYRMDLFGGTLSSSLVGAYALEQEVEPLPGVNPDATYDCAGVINIACQTPDWRHTARTSFSRDWYTASLRWRYIDSMDYKNQNGTPGTTDQILVGKGGALPSYSYFDLSGSFDIMEQVNLTVGVNNIFDKEPPMVGSTLALNANAPGGYDQLGRFMFANVVVRF